MLEQDTTLPYGNDRDRNWKDSLKYWSVIRLLVHMDEYRALFYSYAICLPLLLLFVWAYTTLFRSSFLR